MITPTLTFTIRFFFSIAVMSLIFQTAFPQSGFKFNNYTPTKIEIIPKADQEKALDEKRPPFQTSEGTEWNFLEWEKKNKQDSITNVYLQPLNAKATGRVGTITSPAARQAAYKVVQKLRSRISRINELQDSLYIIYVADYIRSKTCTMFGTYRSRAFYDNYLGTDGKDFAFLKNSGFSLGNQTGSVFTEFVSGNLQMFRLSIGGMVTSSANENAEEGKQNEAFQKLITSGGNAVVRLEYPVVFFHSDNNNFNVLLRAVGRASADLPAAGTQTDSFAGSGSYGLDLYVEGATFGRNIRLFGDLYGFRLKGTDSFKDNLGIEKTAFNFAQLTVGAVVQRMLKISITTNTFSNVDALSSGRWVISVQLLK
jgi:hypothetical protein